MSFLCGGVRKLRHIEALDVEQFAVGDACLGVAAGKDGSVALSATKSARDTVVFALFEVGRINQLEVGGEGQGDAADGVVVDGVIQIPNVEDATVYRAELIAAFIDAAVDLYAVGAVDAGDDDVLTVNDDGVAFFQLRDFHGIVAVVIADDHRQLVAAVFGDKVLVQIKADLQGAVGQVGEVNVGSHRFHTQPARRKHRLPQAFHRPAGGRVAVAGVLHWQQGQRCKRLAPLRRAPAAEALFFSWGSTPL